MEKIDFLDDEIFLNKSEEELIDLLFGHFKNRDGIENKEIIFNLCKEILHRYPNNAYALYIIGECYRLEIGTKIDIKKANECILKSAKMNCEYAQFDYAYFLLQRQDKEGVLWLKKAIKTKNKLIKSKAILLLGSLYEEGNILRINIKKSIKYYEQALSLGNEEALIYLGKLYFIGKGGRNKRHLAFKNCNEYVEKYPNSQQGNYYVARCYLEGIGVEKDAYKAFNYFLEVHPKTNDKFEFWNYFEKSIEEIYDIYKPGTTLNCNRKRMTTCKNFTHINKKPKYHRSLKQYLE